MAIFITFSQLKEELEEDRIKLKLINTMSLIRAN